MRSIGVIGGLGPLATARLYQKVTSAVVAATRGQYPHLVIDSLPLHTAIEEAFIADEPPAWAVRQICDLLDGSIEVLRRAGVDCIALPCNTLQSLGRERVGRRGLEFIDMAALSLRCLRDAGHRRVLTLGSVGMRAFGIYAPANGVELIFPGRAEQAILSRRILELVRQPIDEAARQAIEEIVARYRVEIDAVLLACTDLSSLTGSLLAGRPTIDSLSVLADACAQILIRDVHAR